MVLCVLAVLLSCCTCPRKRTLSVHKTGAAVAYAENDVLETARCLQAIDAQLEERCAYLRL